MSAHIAYRYATAVCTVSAIVLTAAPAGGATTYRALNLTPLGFQPADQGFGFEDILAINEGGAVVGSFVVNENRHAFLWLPAPAFGLCEGLHDLHLEALNADGTHGLSEDESVAHDINEAGFVVGQAGGTDIINGQAIVWVLPAGVKACRLGYLQPNPNFLRWSIAYAVNNDNPPLVVGHGMHLPFNGCPAIVTAFRTVFNFSGSDCPTVTFDLLAPFMGDNGSYARDISDTIVPNVAEAVGFSFTSLPECNTVPCFPNKDPIAWPPDDPLEPLIRTGPGGHEARGNNNARNIVGSGRAVKEEPCVPHALYWPSRTAAPFDLGTVSPLTPLQFTHAEGINNLTQVQVVGWNDSSGHALYWDQNASGGWNNTTDLDTAMCDCSNSIVLIQAHDVNDNGWIVAWGNADPTDPDPEGTDFRAYLLRPVQACPVDLNGDGLVNTVDFLALLQNWTGDAMCANCNDVCCTCKGDIDGDCKINTVDLNALLGSWGTCPGFGQCPQGGGAVAGAGPAGGESGSQSLDEAVEALGFGGLGDYQAWVTAASQDEAFVMGQLLAALLAP